MKLYTCQQGSAEWLTLRLGIPTACKFQTIMATPRKKGERWSQGAKTYLHQLCAEWLIGMPLESGSSAFMARGSGMEAEARAWYAFDRNVDVQQVGFATPDHGLCGASADGLIGDDGLLEIKCFSVVEHVAALLEPPDLSEHRAQIQGGLWIYERTYADRLYYHPTLPKLAVRVEREEAYIAELSSKVVMFYASLSAAQKILTDMGCEPHVPQPREPMPAWNPEWNQGPAIDAGPKIVDAVEAAMEAQAPPEYVAEVDEWLQDPTF